MTFIQHIQPILWVVSAIAGLTFAVWALRARSRALKGTGPSGTSGAAAGRAIRTPLLLLAGVGVFAALIVPSLGFVPPGHRGAVYEWSGGVSPSERSEGITFLVPWVQRMTLVSVRTQKVFSSKVFAQSLDLQEITVVASVNYHVDPARAAELYQSVGPEYRQTVIQPALFQRTKTAIGLVRAEDFASNRAPLAEEIQRELAAQLKVYGIIVEFVNIEDAIFDPAFVTAVKEKVIAEQEAKEQENLVAAKEAIKQQTIIEAEAEAKAIRIKATAQAKANRAIGRSLTPAMLRWQWLVTWNGALPSTLVGGAADATLLLSPDPYAP